MLPKENRLELKSKFPFLKKHGLDYKSFLFIALYHQIDDTAKIGFVVSNKIGKANVRQKVRRQLRESFRPRLEVLSGFEIVVIARSGIVDKPIRTIEAEVEKLAGYLSRRK